MSYRAAAPVSICARIQGREVARAQVLRWENRRVTAAAKKLGVVVPDGDVFVRRAALLDAKLELGSAQIAERLARDVRGADLVGRTNARITSRRRISVTELYISAGSAAGFVAWFAHRKSDERAMLAACPDHFVIRPRSDGQLEVLETTGGSPLATRFFIDYVDTSTLVTAPDPSFPHQIAGVARASDGTAIGGVRHQFRDVEGGFHANLTVEFPFLTVSHMIAEHRWHLACEFSNWIEAALADL
ncbi:hypothetical protein [Polyangium jinanense]|uniref:Uncharacterized protein n=1 Tax=Polyangium jinanense TaxID=2829994 RepID=A0A9X3XDY5_9BACT|nr:hypothetical protein [Polyangium jinanense]MDC3960003.1 hypothetical protein [Polyangium jinanense]MDC3986221.1 hypothetical protein [Polyangium jinanense]